ncbi:glycosyltransferase [Neisseria perflava]|uniref:glycosyltransferase n=1 Tax=Neisseria perflava TaxID=33053 RepID=UPI0020A1AC99|nr:glycosyltransferase [Neisseria perflava]MCP1659211.1 glycosyltransferase involved in cell wall biosynthesis [Neisseria perflava]
MHALIIPSWYPETPDDVNGIFFRLQAQALQRAGVKVGVIAPQFRSLRTHASIVLDRKQHGMKEYVEAGIPTYTYQSMLYFPHIPYIDRNRMILAGMKLFRRYVAEHGMPDVIHAHCVNNGGLIAYQIHKQTGIPYMITEHSTTYARKLIHDWERPMMQQAASHAGARAAVSRDFAALLEQEFKGLKWEYIPNILSAKFEAPVDLINKVPNENFTFCSVAHLQHKKGYDILLPAFSEALKEYPHLQLKIGGGGYEETKLHGLAKELNLQNNVTFLGKLKNDEVLDLMYHSDAFVLASRHETFGVVFIEALSQGLPVIATRCGGPESIVNDSNGLIVPVEGQAALTAALISLYENQKKYDAQTLRKNALNEFGENVVISQITAAYEKITTSIS